MQHNKETGQSVDVWYGDLPRVGVRSLTDDERKNLRSAMLRYLFGTVILWLAFPILLFFALGAMSVAGEKPLTMIPVTICFATAVIFSALFASQ
jgi:predicted permease